MKSGTWAWIVAPDRPLDLRRHRAERLVEVLVPDGAPGAPARADRADPRLTRGRHVPLDGLVQDLACRLRPELLERASRLGRPPDPEGAEVVLVAPVLHRQVVRRDEPRPALGDGELCVAPLDQPEEHRAHHAVRVGGEAVAPGLDERAGQRLGVGSSDLDAQHPLQPPGQHGVPRDSPWTDHRACAAPPARDRARAPGRGPGLGYAGRTHERRCPDAPPGSSRRLAPPLRRLRPSRRRRAARGDQGRAAELVAGALDRPGAAAGAGPEPRGR